ncbi:MAG: GAF domain-containing protein [Candidatus Rokubacteria bacterium]|nr:GAF domain-containing protein [Candidatus Rokubacteria bacterium]
MTPDRLALAQRLRARLRPLALAAGLLISLGLPLSYYALEFDRLRGEAAGDVADQRVRAAAITAVLLVLSVTVGVGLASVIYLYPVRIARTAERHVGDMIARQHGLVEASRLLASTLDLREVLDRLTEIARGLPGIDVVRIWLVDEQRGDIVMHSQAGLRRADVEHDLRLGHGKGLTSAVVELGRPVVLTDTMSDPRLVNRAWFRAEGLASYLGVPLRAGDTTVGALACMSRTAREWSPSEIALAETLGTLAAVAIRNARLYGETEARRHAAEALAEVGRVLAQAHEPEAVSQQVADAICSLLGTRASAVYRLDPESGDLMALAISGSAALALPRGMVFPRGTGMVALAVRERQPVMTSDVLDDPRVTLSADARARIVDAGYAAVLVVPLMVKDRVIGVLGVGDRAGRVFSDDDVRLAQAFADQAALATENARLYTEATRRRQDAEELARFARLLTETLEVGAIGARIVASVLPVFSARSSVLCLVESDRSLRAIAWGGAAATYFPANQLLPPGAGPLGRAAATGAPVQSRDALNDPTLALPEELAARTRAAGDRAVLAVPLFAKSELMGVLAVTAGEPRDFTEAEVGLLQTLADPAALALENARLYQRAQQAYEELAATQAQLVRGETLRAMGELASGVAHHLNNLLAVVLGRLQLARAKTPPAALDRHLELAERAALDGAEVVRRMRGFSRGQPTADLEAVDLNRVAEEVIELTRPRWQDEAQMRGITIDARLEAGTVPLVAGEVAALREVLMNLIMNAIDALPSGGAITVRTWPVPDGAQCEVADTGLGMPREVQRRALEPFFTTKGFQSTGLGLSVTYGIVRRHGGDLVIDSTPGEGTRVRFRLPAAGSVAARRPREPDELAVTSPLRILVVDDEQEVRDVVAEILASQGHEVVQAAGGVEGLAYLDRGVPLDLVLTDLGMPGMTGWEVARAAKARRPTLQVGLLTGWGEQPDAKPEDRAAADFVIAKPVTVDGLRAALATVRRG